MQRQLPIQPAPFSIRPVAWALCAALAACSGSGDSGPGTDVNEGSYSVDDFPEPEPRPEGFQPLGTAGFQALSRDELFAVLPWADGEGRSFRMQDDPEAGSPEIPEIQRLFLGEGQVHAAAFGQLDEDADDELLVATVDAGETRIDLHRVERAVGGELQRAWIRSLPARPFFFEDVRLTLADFDGDARDEICVAARGNTWGNASEDGILWVLDDPADDSTQLFEFAREGRHISLDALPMDVDGDGALELVVGLGGDTTDHGHYAVRLYRWNADAPGFTRSGSWRYLSGSDDFDQSRAVAGDFDRNGTADLAFTGELRRSGSRSIEVRLFEWVAPDEWQQYASTSFVDVRTSVVVDYGDWSAAALRRSMRGHDLAVVTVGASDRTLNICRYQRGADRWDLENTRIDRMSSSQAISLACSDFDADGEEEIQIALLAHPASGSRLDLGLVDHDGTDFQLAWQPPVVLGPASSSSNGRFRIPTLAAGDFDADGLAVEHTGRSELRLADPIPLVLLAAAPTQADISQNYDSTESAYSTGTTQGSSIGVSTYSSITYSIGGGFDLFGALGVEGRASVERGLQRSVTRTEQVSIVQGYRGGHDHDVIVFQGTLYETFEYRILSAPDPAAVGTLMTLDLPIDANTYKWTVDYYNEQVDAEDRIGEDLLTHTPGVLDSYPSQSELRALIGDEQHWEMPGRRPVGQGTASDFQAVSFETAQATEEERTLSRSYGGGVRFGVSVSVDATAAEGSTHGVHYAEETSFEASVGDIASPDDYASWQYDWGFSIHTVNRQSDRYGDRKHSFQYLRFWAEPKAAAN